MSKDVPVKGGGTDRDYLQKRTDDNTGKTDMGMKSRRKKTKDITYNVYRQIESGDVQKIAGGVEKTEYIDKNADKALGTIRYQVISSSRWQRDKAQ